MTNDTGLSTAVVEAIGHTAAPHVDTARLVEIHGEAERGRLARNVLALLAEANKLPID